jgi:hypothetical protein
LSIAIATAADFKPLQSSNHLKKANNHFEKMEYDKLKSKHPTEKGKSRRIASQTLKLAAVVASSQGDLRDSLFPFIEWPITIPALTHCHRRYLVEDCLQCDVNESLVLLILPKHPSFASGWHNCLSAVYKAFPTSSIHFQDGGDFFQSKLKS